MDINLKQVINYLSPIIANGVSKYLAIEGKSTLGYGLFHDFGWFKLCTGVFIPETPRAIGANCGQSTMHRMKGDVIHLEKDKEYDIKPHVQI